MRKVLFSLITLLIYLISILPVRILYLISSLVVFVLGNLFRYRRSVVAVNLARAFPNFRYSKLEKISSKFYTNFGEIIAENIKSISLSKKALSKMGYIENAQLLNKFYKENIPVIIVGGHMGNWELLTKMEYFTNSHLMGYSGSHFNFIYKKQRSKIANEVIKWTRTVNCSVQLIESKRAARNILKNRNKPACYFLFSDQSPKPGSRFLLSFLNQQTLMINGPEVISRTVGCAVVFLEMKRERRGRYIVKLHQITDNPSLCEPGYITHKYAELLEQSIQQNPDNWLWSHKRWKRGIEDNEVQKKISSPSHNK